MLVVMNPNAPKEHIERVREKILKLDCKPHEIFGKDNIAIAVLGNTKDIDKEDLSILPSVQHVLRVSKKYKLVSRMMKNEDTVLDLNGTTIGGKDLFIVAGPCSVEERESVLETAGQLNELGVKFFRAGAYKPRSSPYAFQGLKLKGLQYLDDVKKEFGMQIVTEVLNPRTINEVAEVADILQIGARNMQNFTLLEEAGATGKPILLKRGMSATVEDLLLSAEYIAAQNNSKIILCERGIRTFEKATRNTLDLNAIPVVKKHSHLPIVVDPSHGIGIADKVPAMALASVAAGADGLMLEVHHSPEDAWSDGFQTLNMADFKSLLDKVKQLAPIVGKELTI
ncbi:MAG: 3-deoxy-7-phosphoheptulonate synthase [Melioribacteraceae bacterium]|nr:3-deoxy-7-phosphoheptulonate synthase [Melioribacteraceae bacterium]MCF8264621.1 3-deoxy-7-phosphoheptulonate synthase [Melioribacteraceae bacterium]